MEFYESSGKPISIAEWAILFKTLYADTDGPRKPEEFWNAVMADRVKDLACMKLDFSNQNRIIPKDSIWFENWQSKG